MVHLKTKEEINVMKKGGKILMRVMDEILPMIRVGVPTIEIDRFAESRIVAYGGKSSFKTVKGYNWTTCLPVNHQAVHTPPSSYRLKDGDLLTIDIGVLYEGFHTDYATSLIVGKTQSEKTKHFLQVGEQTLKEAISMIHGGVYLGTIGEYIYKTINGNGYKILKNLTGHGVGRELHEDPYVLNYLDRPVEKTYKVTNGLTIAVEIIYSMSTEQIAYERGKEWSIITSDNSLSACFERSIAIVDEKVNILT